MQLIIDFTELSPRHKQRYPHPVRSHLNRINEAIINAHMTLRHDKNWINYYLVPKNDFAV